MHSTGVLILCFVLHTTLGQGLSLGPVKEQFFSDVLHEDDKRSVAYLPAGMDGFSPYNSYYYNTLEDPEAYRQAKREDQAMPGVLRFGKRSQSFVRFGRSDAIDKKEMPGVLRFGKRDQGDQEKKAVPGVLRFGKRNNEMPGVLRFGKRADMPGVLRFGKRADMPGVLRFGKRADMLGALRFGKKSEMPGVLRFGKRDGEMPGVLRFGRK